MRITEVRTHRLSWALDEPFQSSFSTFHQRAHLLVEIRCDNGLTGWGECLGPAALNEAVVQAMAVEVIGRQAGDIEPIWLHLYNQFRDQGQRGLILTALSGIDLALWDLAGRLHDCPVHQLLGGAYRLKVPAYATGGFRTPGRPRAETLTQEANAAVAAGFSAMKIKIGFGVEPDLADIALVRDLIGPEMALMIDANHGYDRLNALQLARAAAPYNIAWFEEPVVPEDLDGYRLLRDQQPIAIAGGETWHGRWAMAQAISAGAIDILQPDVCGLGGLSEARKVLALAEINHLPVIPHVWGTGLAMAAALHFHATLPPLPLAFETQPVPFEFDQTPNPLRDQLFSQAITLEDGAVRVPTEPGLGMTPRPEALDSYRVRT